MIILFTVTVEWLFHGFGVLMHVVIGEVRLGGLRSHCLSFRKWRRLLLLLHVCHEYGILVSSLCISGGNDTQLHQLAVNDIILSGVSWLVEKFLLISVKELSHMWLFLQLLSVLVNIGVQEVEPLDFKKFVNIFFHYNLNACFQLVDGLKHLE